MSGARTGSGRAATAKRAALSASRAAPSGVEPSGIGSIRATTMRSGSALTARRAAPSGVEPSGIGSIATTLPGTKPPGAKARPEGTAPPPAARRLDAAERVAATAARGCGSGSGWPAKRAFCSRMLRCSASIIRVPGSIRRGPWGMLSGISAAAYTSAGARRTGLAVITRGPTRPT